VRIGFIIRAVVVRMLGDIIGWLVIIAGIIGFFLMVYILSCFVTLIFRRISKKLSWLHLLVILTLAISFLYFFLKSLPETRASQNYEKCKEKIAIYCKFGFYSNSNITEDPLLRDLLFWYERLGCKRYGFKALLNLTFEDCKYFSS
jgi:amino acid transporter